jgi:hypothetical protein
MRTKICLLAIVILCSASFSYAQETSVNLAVIADKAGGLDSSPLISLLEAQLSQNANIKLLERAQIDKIMQEQQLSAAGLLDRANSIKIGQLLRADAFIIITVETSAQTTPAPANTATGTLLRVRFVQTAHGLRLLDCFEQLEQSKLNDTAQAISKRVTAVANKLLVPADQLIPVGIVDIHRVQLGEQYRILERTLPVLLSIRLGLEPKIIMLEREDLKILQDEKLRTQGEDSKFWASAVLIEGNLQPKDGGLEMQLTLRRPAGKDTKNISVSVEPNEPSTAIDKAAGNIVQEILNTPSSAQWQLAAEAEQFYKQGQMLNNHQRYEEALPLFETSHALQTLNVYYTRAMFADEWDYRAKLRNERSQRDTTGRVNFYDPVDSYYSDLDLVEIISIFVRQIRLSFEKGQLSASDINNYLWSRYLGNDIMPSGYFSNSASIATAQIKLINIENRRIWIETINKTVEQSLINRELTPEGAAIITLRSAWISSNDPNEVIANIKRAFKKSVFPIKLGGMIASFKEREHVFEQAFLNYVPMLSTVNLENTHLKGASQEFMKLWQQYLMELTDVNDLFVKVNSYRSLMKMGKSVNDGQNTIEYYYKALDILKKEMQKSDQSQNDIATFLLAELYQQPQPSLNFSKDDFNKLVDTWEGIFEDFINRKDIKTLSTLNSGSHPFGFRNYIRPLFELKSIERFYFLLDRIAEVLQSNKDDKIVNAALNNIKEVQVEIGKAFPEFEISQTTSKLLVKMLLTQKDWFRNSLIVEYNLQMRQRANLPDDVLRSLKDEIPWSEYSYQIKIQDGLIWIALSSVGYTVQDSQRKSRKFVDVGLVGINLAGEKLSALWQERIFPVNSGILNITDFVVSNPVIYLSLSNIGILTFPGSLKEGRGFLDNPKVYIQENGLPSLLITSLAQDSDKLWLAYGDMGQESGLGLYDPKTERWETIFCSTLKGDSPFSQGQPYLIESMLLESPDKLLFSVRGNNFTQAGLWKLNTDTLELKYIWSGVADIYKDFNNNIWLNSSAYKIDPDSERITMIIQPGRHQLYPNVVRKISGISKDLFVPESFSNNVTFGPYYTLNNLDLSTSTIHNNKLWARLGRSQILIVEKGKTFEEAQIIDNNILDGKPIWKFVSTPYGLIAIGEGTVGLIETE